MTTLNVSNLPLANPGALPTTSTLSTQAINHADNTKAGAVFLAPLAGATSKITEAGCYVSAVAGTPGANSYRISLQGVTTAGVPDGTIKSGSGSNDVYVLWTPSATGWSGWLTLGGSGYSPSVGEPLAVVVEQVSTDGTNYITVGYGVTTLSTPQQPFGVSMASGTWTVSVKSPMTCVRYANGLVPNGMYAVSSVTNTGWGSGTAPLYRGTKWTPQVDCRLAGVYVIIRPAAASDFNVKLFSGASPSSPDVSVTVDASQVLSSTSSAYLVWVPMGNVSLTAGTVYRFVVEPTTSTAMSTAMYADFADAGGLRAIWGELSGTVGTSGFSWTDYSTRAYFVIPIIDQITIDYPDSGNVLTTDTVAGVAGTFHAPEVSEVLSSALTGDQAGSAAYGTFDEAARNTDPGEANVVASTGYKIANVSKTGTYVGGGSLSTADLQAIHLAKAVLCNRVTINEVSRVITVYDDNGSTALDTLTPTEVAGVLTLAASFGTVPSSADVSGELALIRAALANSRVQTRATGAVDYYDAAGTTVLKTMTTGENSGLIEVTPS